MSWSVTAVGKPAKVAEAVAKQIAAVKCSEPEETIKNTLGTAIATALAAFPPGVAAKVEASGSQYVPDTRKPDEKQNTFSVSVQAIYGFVE